MIHKLKFCSRNLTISWWCPGERERIKNVKWRVCLSGICLLNKNSIETALSIVCLWLSSQCNDAGIGIFILREKWDWDRDYSTTCVGRTDQKWPSWGLDPGESDPRALYVVSEKPSVPLPQPQFVYDALSLGITVIKPVILMVTVPKTINTGSYRLWTLVTSFSLWLPYSLWG